VAFLTAGYPDEETFVELVRAADRSGCTAIEIGVPFSDPIADGPLIQQSSKVALDGGMTLARSLEIARDLQREIAAPLVFMGYYNPILRMQPKRFADAAVEAGVTGVIIPDVSFEESSSVRSALQERGLAYIDRVAPTSSEERIGRIVAESQGFVYLVSVTGVTGVRSPQASDLESFVTRVRAHTDMPLYVGFGISGPDKARETARTSDGVIIGSALIRLVQSAPSKHEAIDKVETFLREVSSAIAGGSGVSSE
jgi:tryptophan synthase alpha chain